MFSTIFLNKVCCSLAEKKIGGKSKMTAEIADILSNDCCHSNSS